MVRIFAFVALLASSTLAVDAQTQCRRLPDGSTECGDLITRQLPDGNYERSDGTTIRRLPGGGTEINPNYIVDITSPNLYTFVS